MSDLEVVAVVGYSRRGATELHPLCAGRLQQAERLASGAQAVILSGRGESDLMLAAWSGPDVPLYCDEARTTAANAAHVAAKARELGATRLVVVTSRWHRLRVWLLMRAALRGSGIELSVQAADGPRPPLLLAREAACLVLLPLQLPRALL
jgi:uncharacterized SAM-binding protein YcdF (DUF218 family)